jgi:hypothetical protein
MAKSVDNTNPDLENASQGIETKGAKFSDLKYISIVICWAAMLVFTFHACTHMVAAGDTWVAMACGRHFVNHGVDTVEPFSANSHKAGPTEEEISNWPGWAKWITEKVGIETVKKWHPTGWINQNWLTHVIFYSLVPKSSYADGVSFPSNALVYWKFTIYILTVICVFYTGRLLGVHPWLCAVFCCFAMFAGRSFIDIRPAGFSNMLVAVFLLILALTTYRNALYIWLLVPLTVFWCNVHGGYIYAFIMLMPFVGWHILMILPQKRWTHSIYSMLAWMVLYALGYKFLSHAHLTPISPGSDWIFFLILLFVGLCIFITVKKRIIDQKIYIYNIAASVLIFLILLPRFFPAIPSGLSNYHEYLLKKHIVSSQLAYFGISVFIILVSIVLTYLKEKISLNLSLKGICHAVAAGFVAFVATVVFNPFHLTNLTHTFVISVSEHAARWRNIHEWHPAFDWSNPVGTAVPFLIMYIIGWLAFLVWIFVMIRSSKVVVQQSRRKMKISDSYQWPKIDISLIVIAGMTIYMAIRSRRFIPIAAIAACPIIAMLIDQVVRIVSAFLNFEKNKHLNVGQMGYNLQLGFVLAGAMITMYFGVLWGLKFKRIYLDEWPRDPKLTSIFMRMTDSGQKPFYACKFIKDNKLKGNMFNAWTEGGFIAFGQEPDPNTGKTPLQLFMDGRAQAAYDRSAFDLWTEIMAGGQEVTGQILWEARLRKRDLNSKDYVKIGKWMDEQLRKYNVWVVLMPQSKYSIPPRSEYYDRSSFHAIQGLEHNLDWRLVFLNNKQRLYVNTKTPQGKALFDGIFNGKTIYPDEFHHNLIRAHSWLFYRQGIAEKKRGFDFAVKAFELEQSPAPMLEIILTSSRFAELRPEVKKFCENYFKQFGENERKWIKEDGFRDRVEAGRLACFYLGNLARAQNDKKLEAFYTVQQNNFVEVLIMLARIKRW